MKETNKHSDYPFSNLIRSISLKMKYNADKKVAELGLNAQQGRMIGYIYEHQDRGVIQKDLAEVFQKTEASITSMLQGLEKKGYIERKILPENERQKQIFVLPKAVELIDDFYRSFDELEQNITSNLTDEERDILYTLLKKIDTNF